MKKILFVLMNVVFLISFTECIKNEEEDITDDNLEEVIDNTENTADDAEAENEEGHEDAADYVWDENSVVPIILNGSSININGSGATANGSKLTVTSAGTYSISGSLNDGQIIINTEDAEIVRLILNGVDINCSNNAAINITSAKKSMIVLADDTENRLKDGSSYVFANSGDDEPNATIFSKGDLTIYGNGSLTIDANYNDGIASKDGLIIKSGTISIDAVDDGIRGKDYLIIKDGDFTLNTGGDGLKSDNDENSARGYISIIKGEFKIVASGDGIQAETDVIISDGTFNLTTGGGSSKSVSSTISSKGIKGTVSVIIDSGTFTISSADDAIHSNKSLSINNGSFAISSGDDGIHADSSLGINGGVIDITKSYEGIESEIIKITDGNIHIKSSDDGLNVAGGNDGSGMGGWPGQYNPSSGNYFLYLNGGYIYIDADGDGLDCNGTVEMTAGTVLVDGPTSNGNGAIDYDGSFKISGGFLIAAGSSGMAQAPGSSSSQNSLLIKFSSSKQAGTLVHLQNDTGNNIFTFAPIKKFQSVVFSSPDLVNGTSYEAYLGGSYSGTKTDGLYSGGTYTAGSKIGSFTISETVTRINN